MYEFGKSLLFNNNEFLHTHTDRTGLGLEKGQSAIEYLMTYGWMLLVVAIVGATIFSLAQSEAPDTVSGFTGGDVIVDDFGLTEDDDLQLDLRDGSGRGSTVKAINVTDESSGEYVYKEFSSGNVISVGESLVLGLPNVSESEGSNSLDVDIFYDSGGLENMSVSGSISGSLTVDDTTELNNDGGGGSGGALSEPSVGGEWSHVAPAGSEGGYDYFFNTSTTPYGTTYGGNSSVEYTNDGFFVMKYQAAKNGSLPVSNGSAGWNDISFNDDSAQTGPSSYTACENLDSQTSAYDVHLVTNREWMTVARQVAQRPDNWADGVVGSTGGSGGLYQGNHDEGGSYDRAVNLGGYPEPNSSGGSVERTHNLSSGDRVWDMSADLRTLVDAEEDGTAMSNPDATSSKIYERTAFNSTVIGGDGLGTDDGFNDVYAAIRGGYWYDGDSAGVFRADSLLPDYAWVGGGFRCSAVPVS